MPRHMLLTLTASLLLTMVTTQHSLAADPDAKGTVGVSLSRVLQGNIRVNVTRTATAPWQVGTVRVFAIPEDGGVLDSKVIPFPQIDGVEQPDIQDFGVFTVPNGKYTVWAIHSLQPAANSNDTAQDVGSDLLAVTVSDSTVTRLTGGAIIFTETARTTGGIGIKCSGSYSVATTATPAWMTDPSNSAIRVTGIPIGGGVVRSIGTVKSPFNPPTAGGNSPGGTWTTNPYSLYVRAELQYNLYVGHGVCKTTMADGQAIGTWAKNK